MAEFGRIDKTLHTLTYIDDENQRRSTLIQLNRGEGRHRLGRAVKLRWNNFVGTVRYTKRTSHTYRRSSTTISTCWDAIRSQSLKPSSEASCARCIIRLRTTLNRLFCSVTPDSPSSQLLIPVQKIGRERK